MGAATPAVCVFCASSTQIDARYPAHAAEVGAELARRGWQVVSGGGSISSMGALASAARAAGGWTVGVIPQGLLALEVADTEADELLVTPDMRSRKALMDERSDAFLVLPGGIGTMEEFFEAWVGVVLGMHDKPVVVLDPWDDFAELRRFIDAMVARRFVTAEVVARVVWTPDLTEAMTAIEQRWAHPAQPVAGGTRTEIGLESD